MSRAKAQQPNTSMKHPLRQPKGKTATTSAKDEAMPAPAQETTPKGSTIPEIVDGVGIQVAPTTTYSASEVKVLVEMGFEVTTNYLFCSLTLSTSLSPCSLVHENHLLTLLFLWACPCPFTFRLVLHLLVRVLTYVCTSQQKSTSHPSILFPNNAYPLGA